VNLVEITKRSQRAEVFHKGLSWTVRVALLVIELLLLSIYRARTCRGIRSVGRQDTEGLILPSMIFCP
jgi:hypothetical protein